MSSFHESGHDDQQLTDYLLGLLPEEDAERLDELNIADDEMACRLLLAENELVDAYVRGTLAVDTRARFESVYLSSSRRRQRVIFARRFLRAADRGGVGFDDVRASRAAPAPAAKSDVTLSPDSLRHLRIVPRSVVPWAFAAVAALLLLASGAARAEAIREGGRVRHARAVNP